MRLKMMGAIVGGALCLGAFLGNHGDADATSEHVAPTTTVDAPTNSTPASEPVELPSTNPTPVRVTPAPTTTTPPVGEPGPDRYIVPFECPMEDSCHVAYVRDVPGHGHWEIIRGQRP